MSSRPQGRLVPCRDPGRGATLPHARPRPAGRPEGPVAERTGTPPADTSICHSGVLRAQMLPHTPENIRGLLTLTEALMERGGRLLKPSDGRSRPLRSAPQRIEAGDRLVTPARTAEVLGVTTPAVRKWILQRRLPVVRVGRCVRVRLSVVEQIMRDGLPGKAAR